MSEQEGVIKFQLDFVAKPCLLEQDVLVLNSWRFIMLQLGMLGQDPNRYDNYGFGNISQRHPAGFMISGTQTGGKAELNAADYALVTDCLPLQNRIVASGLIKPSSEAMTHGQLYLLDPQIHFVIHVHCPVIWQQAAALELPQTRPEVPYGTVAMADEVQALFAQSPVLQTGVFSMAGHQDGVVAFGASAEQAGQRLLACYGRALQAQRLQQLLKGH